MDIDEFMRSALSEAFDFTDDQLDEIELRAHCHRRWHRRSIVGGLPIHGPCKPRCLVPVEELPDATWRTRDGQVLPISEMDDDHLVNTYLMLARTPPVQWHLHYEAKFWSAPDDVVKELVDREWDRATQYGDVEYRATRAHVARRRLWRLVVHKTRSRSAPRTPFALKGNSF